MRTKGMINLDDRSALIASAESRAAEIVASLPSGLPIPSCGYPTKQQLFTEHPVMLVSGEESATMTLENVMVPRDESDPMSEHAPAENVFGGRWQQWLNGLSQALRSWLASVEQAYGSTQDVASLVRMYSFGGNYVGFDRKIWVAGSMDQSGVEVAEIRAAIVAESRAMAIATAGRNIAGIGVPEYDFNRPMDLVLEDGVSHTVGVWSPGVAPAGDDTEFESNVRMVLHLIAVMPMQVGISEGSEKNAISDTIRIWGHGSQTDGRGV